MTSARAKKIASQLNREETKFGDIKKLGRQIKKDHDLAHQLWATGDFRPRLLSTLIFDKMLLDQKQLDRLANDMLDHTPDDQNNLADWLLANQLTKSKASVALLESWQENPSPILRRLFWYHQARLRWTGQRPPDNTSDLLDALERDMASAPPSVQWAMNFCAGWIGVHQPKFRSRCIKLGKTLGLYEDERVAKNCTPSYLPEFIRIESEKVNK